MKLLREAKYQGLDIYWCGLCDTFGIACPHCDYGSCTGGGCDKCIQLWKDWDRDYTQATFLLDTAWFKESWVDPMDALFAVDESPQDDIVEEYG